MFASEMNALFRLLAAVALVCTVVVATAQTQQTKKPLHIVGKTGFDSGRVFLLPFAGSTYYAGSVAKEYKLKRGGAFEFNDSIAYPTAFLIGVRVGTDWKYMSNVFFTESGEQYISCKDNRVTPSIENETMREYIDEYLPRFDRVNKDLDNLYDLKDSMVKRFHQKIPPSVQADWDDKMSDIARKEDLILLKFTQKHPKSFIPLWKMAEMLPGGYKSIFDSVYSTLDNSVKYTFTGQRFKTNLENVRRLDIGKKFPQLQAYNAKQQKAYTPDFAHLGKYTLVHFWLSSSYPSIRQFPAWIDLYKHYHDSCSFDILSISVDDKSFSETWTKTIAEYHPQWQQFIDWDKKIAETYCIDFCPVNFLLDEKGFILKRNITPQEMEQILKNR